MEEAGVKMSDRRADSEGQEATRVREHRRGIWGSKG